MEHGPVPSSILNLLGELAQNAITSDTAERLSQRVNVEARYRYPHFSVAEAPSKFDCLSRSDLESLKAVADEHGRKSFEELKAFTHEMAAYKRVWENRTNNSPTMRFEDFFDEDEEAIAGVFEEMVENDQLGKTFGSFV